VEQLHELSEKAADEKDTQVVCGEESPKVSCMDKDKMIQQCGYDMSTSCGGDLLAPTGIVTKVRTHTKFVDSVENNICSTTDILVNKHVDDNMTSSIDGKDLTNFHTSNVSSYKNQVITSVKTPGRDNSYNGYMVKISQGGNVDSGCSRVDNLRAVKGDVLLDEHGSPLSRKLGLSDGARRKAMVNSVKGTVQFCENLSTSTSMANTQGDLSPGVVVDGADWKEVCLGRTFVSGGTKHNLFAAVPAQFHGLGTHMPIDGGGYLFDRHGNKFPMHQVGNQLRFSARLCGADGGYREVEFVHDTGAAATIIGASDAVLWEDPGGSVVHMGGYTGEVEQLVGGADLVVKLLTVQQHDFSGVHESTLEATERFDIHYVLAAIDHFEQQQGDQGMDVETSLRGKMVVDAVADGRVVEGEGDVVDRILAELTQAQRQLVFEKVKSATALVTAVGGQRFALDVKRVQADSQLREELGVTRRLMVMEELSKQFPHLTMESMNRMVVEGDIPNGIEYRSQAKPADEATMIAKATRTRIHRKRDPKRGDDPGLGHRPPFFCVMADLVDLTNETKGNRWGYNFLLVLICKETGLLKLYPMKGKDDVVPRWCQYRQFIDLISPYVVAKLGVKPKVCIFANDRGPEFLTTRGMARGELDEVLFKEGVARWSPSAGDSNKLGKVERTNRTIVEAVNVMLRRGGAHNTMAWDAFLFFEHHYNISPTSANKLGKGEAPFKTLGIPIDFSRIVRFFCPAWLRTPKASDVVSGKSVSQTKLVAKATRCFIIGYGTGITLGGDGDGYKVLVASTGEVYTSNDVTPTPHMEVSKSLLTGLAHDPLNEGVLLRRVLDVDGTEKLVLPTDEEVDVDTSTVQVQPLSTTAVASPPLTHRGMTVATGVTGQMRAEMDPPRDKTNSKCVYSRQVAKNMIDEARRRNGELLWKAPDVAKKRGDSALRYNIYWKANTFAKWDQLIRRKDARHEDLVNDVQRELCVFSGTSGGGGDVEAEAASIHHVGFTFGEHCRMRELPEQLRCINFLGEEVTDDMLLEVVHAARETLGDQSEIPLWMALAVFHRAEVWVDGRIQPYTIKQAMRLKEWPEWKEAIMKEIQGLLQVGVWREIPRSSVTPGTKILPGRMVLEIKTVDGKFDKCKARYVSRGDKSNKGEHYFESSSHQVRSKSLRMFFAMAVVDYARTGKKSYVPRNLDIKQAYIQRVRDEDEPEVVMELPEETFGLCRDKYSGYVAFMLRHLYGEVDGGRAFERFLLTFLDQLGAKATVSDRMVFKWEWNGDKLTALAHVDDILYNGTSDAICDQFFKEAERFFGSLTGGAVAEVILGIKIEWDFERLTVKLSQRAHAEKFLAEFGFDGTTRTVATPMPLDVDLKDNEGRRVPLHDWDYFKWVGFANWLATMTRPDLAFVTNLCARFAQNPGDSHVAVQRHVLRYIAGTLDEGLTFHGSPQVLSEPYDHTNKLIGYVDSMHGPGHDTMCIMITLNGAAVISKVLKQRVVTTSTSHSEMIALAAGTRELHWATDFMAELGHEQGTVRLLGDNQSANLQASGDYKSVKSDHYRRVQFYVEDSISQGIVWVDKVDTADNIADIGTKQVKPIRSFQRLRDIAHGKTPFLYLSNTVKDILAGKFDGVKRGGAI
jgi:hypothetical protein